MMTFPEFAPAIPEIVTAVGVLALLMVGVFSGERSTSLVTTLSVVLLIVAGVLVVGDESVGTTFAGAFISDDFARYMKLLVLAGAALSIVMSTAYTRAARFERFEYPVLIVIATLGMMMMISASDLIAVYLGIELMSLASYVVAAINRDSVRSTEAGLKYFVLGALSSGMLLYGMSLVYGFTGETTFAGIAARLGSEGVSIGFVFGLVFTLTGLCFKISAVPFHMWTPDVYEGAPTPVTAFFASAPKVASFAVMIRIVVDAFGPATVEWQQILVFVSIASMALGAFAAIGQRNIKRLMAYSSIGHAGFALVGLAAGTETGIRGVIIYLTIYLAMTLGAFACILAMRRSEGMVEDVSELAGLARTNPIVAFIFAMILFSLAGVPPLAGFFAKFYVFLAAIESGLYVLAVLGVLSSVVGAYYYLRLVKIMYFDEPAGAFESMPGGLRVVLGLSGLVVMLFVVFAAPIVEAAGAAASSLF